jgi:hypothetical protein
MLLFSVTHTVDHDSALIWKSVGVTTGFQGLSLVQTIVREERVQLEQRKAFQLGANP